MSFLCFFDFLERDFEEDVGDDEGRREDVGCSHPSVRWASLLTTNDDVGVKDGDAVNDEKEDPSASIQFVETTTVTRRSEDRDKIFIGAKCDWNEDSFGSTSCITRRGLRHFVVQELSLEILGIFRKVL